MIAQLVDDLAAVREVRRQRRAAQPALQHERSFDGTTPGGQIRFRDPDGMVTILVAQHVAAPGPARQPTFRERLRQVRRGWCR